MSSLLESACFRQVVRLRFQLRVGYHGLAWRMMYDNVISKGPVFYAGPLRLSKMGEPVMVNQVGEIRDRSHVEPLLDNFEGYQAVSTTN